MKAGCNTKNAEECYFAQSCTSSQHSEKKTNFCGAKKPSAVDTLKFGKIIKPVERKNLNVGVEEFNIESKTWVVLGPASFLPEIAPLGEGWFPFKASKNHRKLRDATDVRNRYKTLALENTGTLK